ncbi:MAG: Sua5/YciO/YrdC/YwlC family protein [Moraxella sp.]|nr:Sua5/YciO/YrdC/YwlC family protein [Moraxella sp.]
MADNITSDVALAGEWLSTGRLLAYPSESVWGIGCDAFCERAVQDLLSLKSRVEDKGLIVLTDKVARIMPLLTHLPNNLRGEVIQKLSQTAQTAQAQTWLLPVYDMPKFLTGQYDSLAVRITTHPLLQALCKKLVSSHNPYGFLVSTSCNPNSSPPAQSIHEAYNYFGDDICYLQGVTLNFDKPSQIIDILTGQVIR